MNKVTIESIQAKIASVIYTKLSPKITHCIITMENGYQVTGESACVDPANYVQEIGEKIAYDNAFNKIWAVEGYLLQEKLFKKYQQELIEADDLENYVKSLDDNIQEVTTCLATSEDNGKEHGIVLTIEGKDVVLLHSDLESIIEYLDELPFVGS